MRPNRARYLLLLAAPVAVVLTWLLWDIDVAVAPAPRNDPASADQPGTGAAAASSRTGAPPPALDRPAPDRTVVATTPSAGDADEWLDLRVVDRATGTPVEGALVRWFTAESSKVMRRMSPADRLPYYTDRERIATEFGYSTRTDRDGMTRVTADPATGAQVFARHDGHWGSAAIGGRRAVPADGWQVEIDPDLTLRTRVLDSSGQPAAGVTVAIHWTDARQTEPLPLAGFVGPVTSTAPDGAADYLHVQSWFRVGSVPTRARDGNLIVRAELPGWRHPGVPFDRHAPPADPIEFQLPATGALRLRALRNGRPLRKRVGFRITRADGPANTFSRRLYPDEYGVARASFVPIGQQLRVKLDTVGLGHAVEIAGPRHAGHEVDCDLHVESTFCLSGTFVLPNGEPLAAARVRVVFDVGISSGNTSLETDADGRFFWLIGDRGDDEEQVPVKRLGFTADSSDGTALQVDIQARAIRRGITDLGTLQLTAGPLVVAGRLLVDGEPSRYVGWTVEAQTKGPGGDMRWRRVAGLTQSIAEDGAFEIRGTTTAARHRMRFRARTTLPHDPVEFSVGTRDVEIALSAGHKLTAELLAPADVGREDLRAVLRPPTPPPPEPDAPRAQRSRFVAQQRPAPAADEPIALLWHALPAGTYDLELRATGAAEPLHVVRDVLVGSSPTADPRLHPIDLRPHVRRIDLDVRLPRTVTEQPGAVSAFVLPQSDKSGWRGVPITRDRRMIFAPQGPVTLWVGHPGCRPAEIQCPSSQASVTVGLSTWPTVAITIAGLPELPPDLELRLSASNRAAREQNRLRFETRDFGGPLAQLQLPPTQPVAFEDGIAHVPIGDGPHHLRASLRNATTGHSKSLRNLQPVTIDGNLAGTTVLVQIPPDQVTTAIRLLSSDK